MNTPNTNLVFITQALVFRGGRGDLFVGLLYTMEASVPFTSLRAALQRSNHYDAGLNSKGFDFGVSLCFLIIQGHTLGGLTLYQRKNSKKSKVQGF